MSINDRTKLLAEPSAGNDNRERGLRILGRIIAHSLAKRSIDKINALGAEKVGGLPRPDDKR